MNKSDALLALFIVGDLILVLIIGRRVNKYWGIPKKTLIIGSLISVPAGLIGSAILRRIEYGTWSGLSYFGVILISPIIMILVGTILKTNPKAILDIGAPIACAVISLMKLQCWITGCCIGRIINHLPNGRVVRFPSQPVEMIWGLILLFVIMRIEQSEKQRGYVYAWFLLLYGCSRFVLTLLRDTRPFLLGLPGGCVWSLLSIAIGGGVLLAKHRIEIRQLGNS